jgi:hypothetical protein
MLPTDARCNHTTVEATANNEVNSEFLEATSFLLEIVAVCRPVSSLVSRDLESQKASEICFSTWLEF